MEHKGTTSQGRWMAANGLAIQIEFIDGSAEQVKIAHENGEGIAHMRVVDLLQAAAMVVQACAEQDRWYIQPRVCADHGPHHAEQPCAGCRAAELDAGEVIR